jgi:hypothetical protein
MPSVLLVVVALALPLVHRVSRWNGDGGRGTRKRGGGDGGRGACGGMRGGRWRETRVESESAMVDSNGWRENGEIGFSGSSGRRYGRQLLPWSPAVSSAAVSPLCLHLVSPLLPSPPAVSTCRLLVSPRLLPTETSPLQGATDTKHLLLSASAAASMLTTVRSHRPPPTPLLPRRDEGAWRRPQLFRPFRLFLLLLARLDLDTPPAVPSALRSVFPSLLLRGPCVLS